MAYWSNSFFRSSISFCFRLISIFRASIYLVNCWCWVLGSSLPDTIETAELVKYFIYERKISFCSGVFIVLFLIIECDILCASSVFLLELLLLLLLRLYLFLSRLFSAIYLLISASSLWITICISALSRSNWADYFSASFLISTNLS